MGKNDPYKGRIYPEDKIWEKSPWTELLKERYSISSLLCKNKTVLDSCCGTGWGTLNYIVPIARLTTGFDICTPPVIPDEYSDKCSFLEMDAKNITLNNSEFEVLLALDSLEHFTYEDGSKYLSGLYKACSNTGILVGSTPLVPHKNLIPFFLECNKYHFYMYTKEELEKQLKRIFPLVEIFELYNPICPYFIFLCGKSSKISLADQTSIVKTFIATKKKEYKKGRLKSYLYWAKVLLIRKNICTAFHFIHLYINLIFGKK